MASGKTVTATNLEALGAARLATLLLEIANADATIKRRLRLELAGSAGPAEAARQITKRLQAIATARSFIDWHKVKPLLADLEGQRRAILDHVAPTDPREAFELVWRLVSCAAPVFARSDDGSGRLDEFFKEAVRDLGPLAEAGRLDPADLAGRAVRALRGSHYDEWNQLVPVLAPRLGATGLGLIRQMTADWQAEPVVPPPEHERVVIGWGLSGKVYADQLDTSHREHTTRMVLQQIADLSDDVDGYIAQIDPKARKAPAMAASIAARLLEAGRPQDAWKALEAVDPDLDDWMPEEWEQVRAETLDALGRTEEAQAFRWERFLATLNPVPLRAYLRKLPDFDDFTAEQRALAHASAAEEVHEALAFLVEWPDLTRAGQLVLSRAAELDGNFYELLSPAAEALAARQPLAATLLKRTMIDFTLRNARAARYKHAARHLRDCADLARHVADFAGTPDHATYEKTLRETHGRKAAFWTEVGGR